ncbi:glycosyltransferase [Vibrio vulnificus]|nr:glycosyltransferase [Vibrio vulnificus]ELI0348339.1 glycosyltransferase [Vibrio vulnificus]MVT22042.1 glycosyltransferase [Vibrio vulnificus]QBH28370.1 Glycosyltransferase [Vibrio vulnificus]HAS6281468.1 glycosyltransferase [Vibrio vulnificus]
MCVYDGDDSSHISDSIISILNQTIPVDLYVFQDGFVNESISNVLFFFRKKIFLVQSADNVGLAMGLNNLIETILPKQYDYVARMDADDISYMNRIESQVSFLNSNDEIDVLGTSCREFGSSFSLEEKHLPERHEDLLDFSIARCPFIHPTVMFRMSVFELGYRYPINTTLTEDMALWFILLNSGFKFANINDILLDYRLNENTVNRRRGISKAVSEFKIRFKYMISLKRVSFKNFILVLSRLAFHLVSPKIIALCYKYLR